MTVTISFGWWILPAVITVVSFIGWRMFGVRMDTHNVGYLPDFGGCLFEIIGYLAAALLSVSAWLLWSLLCL